MYDDVNVCMCMYVCIQMYVDLYLCDYMCNDRTSNIDGIMVDSVGDVWFVVVLNGRWIRVV